MPRRRRRRRSGGAAAASAPRQGCSLGAQLCSCGVLPAVLPVACGVNLCQLCTTSQSVGSKRCSLCPGWRTAAVRERPAAEGQQAIILIDALAQQLPQVQPMLALHVLHRCLQGQSKSVCLAREYLHALAALPCSSTQKTQKGLAGWLHQGSALHSCCSENMPCQFIMAHLPKLRGAQA